MRLRRSGGAFIYLSAFSFSLTKEFPLSAVSFVSVVVQKDLTTKTPRTRRNCVVLQNPAKYRPVSSRNSWNSWL